MSAMDIVPEPRHYYRAGKPVQSRSNSVARLRSFRIRSAVPVSLTILGSGSDGNCAYLETDGTRLLIDAGLSLRQIRKRLATIGRAPESLTGVLVTHEHSDHIQAIRAIGEKLHVPIYCNRPTLEAIEEVTERRLDCRLFTTGATFELGDVTV